MRIGKSSTAYDRALRVKGGSLPDLTNRTRNLDFSGAE